MKKVNLWKLLLQFTVLGWLIFLIVRVLADSSYSVDFEAYCPFGGLQALSSYLVNESLACSMTAVQIVMGLVFVVGIILISKLFCAFICPLGTIAEYLGKLGDKLGLRFTVRGAADIVLRSLKYVLLFITFYFTIGSSELFCKNFDPFYASVSGYDYDVTAWMAITATAILILGSVFIRMFWCKYICPLGAVSNVFKFLVTFVAVFGIFLIIRYAGVEMSWIWPLGAVCVLSYLFEIFYRGSRVFPLFKITRNEDKCIDCGRCSDRCPQGIDVMNLKTVKHIDCTLCGDCLTACPESGALTINNNKKLKSSFLPALITVVLVAAGIYLGSTVEIATIDEKWGTEEQMSNARTVSKSGLANIHCFGSSKAFAAKMKKVQGVLGVATYVKSHTVKIYYNPDIISEEGVMEEIFTPAKLKINNPPKSVKNMKMIELGVENLFDKMDVNYLMLVFRDYEGYYGLVSEYGCPVKITLYADEDKVFDEEELRRIVETKEYVLKAHNVERKFDLDYELVYAKETDKQVTRADFMNGFFRGYSSVYKKKEEKYKDAVRSVYEIPYPNAEKPIISRYFPFFSSHLSSIEGVVDFSVVLKPDDSVVMHIGFIEDVIDAETLWSEINAGTWHITYRGGNVKEEKPKFGFKNKGTVLKQ